MAAKSKLRIAIVISHPIQHFCPQYVNFSQNGNVEVKVFFASMLGLQKYTDVNFRKEISWGNLHLDQFDHLFLNGNKVLQPDKNLDAPSLGRELDNFQPGLVIIYGNFQKLQRRAKRWAVKNGIRTAYISDSELLHERNTVKELFKRIYLRNYFSDINYFLTLGNWNEDFYKKYGVPEEKLLGMHHPIDFARYQESYLQIDLLRKNIRGKYGISENEIILSVVGKLVEWKNQDHIIDAMKLLENEGVYLTLFILGSGKKKTCWQEKSKELKKSKVFFPGFVKIEELPSYYAASDIYVHPASVEPHSVAVSEAIMMGCPVILSDKCGSYGDEDDVQEGMNGYVFEFGNIKDLAEKIKQLAMNDKRRKAFADYSHNIAVSFQQKSHFGIIETLVKELRKEQFNNS